MLARQGVRMFPIRCPDNSDMLSGCFRNQCPDVAEIRTFVNIMFQLFEFSIYFRHNTLSKTMVNKINIPSTFGKVNYRVDK